MLDEPKPAKQINLNAYSDIIIARYACQKGEGIQTHTHDDRTKHVTIVASGSIRAFGLNIDQVVKAGDMLDFTDYEQTHAITALEDGTVFFNVQKRLDR